MHAIGNINAVMTPADIQAIMSTPQGKAVRAAFRLMAQAGLETPGGRIARADLDRKMAASSLSPRQRLEVKIALERGGLLL